ncbi:uncharacterized protein LOC143035710 isoform X2 [Oratosquilla oratoria]|uniref:uncharacterized protein LOC143035710 isoform X2 n=1 Tax=Oratosquilla oratoria TaxID=337810 RepID=UPI003F773CFA
MCAVVAEASGTMRSRRPLSVLSTQREGFVVVALLLLLGTLTQTESADAAHRRDSGSGNSVTKPPEMLVDVLRQVLRVPQGSPPHSTRGERPGKVPPPYMVDLYMRISEGSASLKYNTNTVRSFTPVTGLIHGHDMLVFNITSEPGTQEQVVAAELHIRGSHARSFKKARPRLLRLLMYDVTWDVTPSTPPITSTPLKQGWQEVDVTSAVRKVLKKNLSLLGLRVEVARRHGSYEEVSLSRLMRTPPLLLVYTRDPLLEDLAAFGASALNLTRNRQENYKRFSRSPRIDARAETSTGDTKDGESFGRRRRRSLEDPAGGWKETNSVLPPAPHAHTRTHALSTNELPDKMLEFFGFSKTEPEESPATPSRSSGKGKGGEKKGKASEGKNKRRRKKKKKKKEKEENYDLIPVPENYPKAEWGGFERRRRRKNKRRLPEAWTRAAQNSVSNDALPAATSSGSGNVEASPMTSVCGRHKLEVDFEELGWKDWVILPNSFRPHYCAGVCPYPLTKGIAASNHAIVQSLLHALGSRPDVPSPCCAPDKLDSLTMLLEDAEGRVLLKVFQGMSVLSCSCQ